MAIGATIATLAATGFSINERRKAQKAEEGAAEADKRAAEVENTRRRRQAIAQARVERARIRNLGAVTGATGSSSVEGAAGSVQSDVAGAIGFQNVITGLNNRRLDSLTRASRHSSRAKTGADIASFTSNFAGGFGERTPTTQDPVPVATSGVPMGGGNNFQTFAAPSSVPGAPGVSIRRFR